METRVLNQAIKRNIESFPEVFLFRLTKEEWDEISSSQIVMMSSQSVMTSKRPKSAMPYAFTEHGVTMLASVLKSPKARKMNIAIVRAFVALRKTLLNIENLKSQIQELETKYGLSNFLVAPNPANNSVKVNFSIDKARFIAYEVRSIDGKLIEWANVGMFPSGQNTLPLEVSNYAAGNYQVSIVIDGEQIFSTQMSVVK